jgi:hypothetical protein
MRVGFDRGPEPVDVVPEPPDEDGRLVDERQASRNRLDRPVPEQSVAPVGRPGEGRELRRLGAHEDVDAGRVATAHLEPAERVQHSVDRPVAVARRGLVAGNGE